MNISLLSDLLIHTKKNGECLEWTRSRTRNYGNLRHGDRHRLAHQLAWELANGVTIAPGHIVRHTCDNPPCVNPKHLKIGTMLDNSRDMKDRRRAASGKKNGRYTMPERTSRGERSGASKLTWRRVLAIRASPAFCSVLANRFGVSEQSVNAVRNFKSWRSRR